MVSFERRNEQRAFEEQVDLRDRILKLALKVGGKITGGHDRKLG